MHLLFSFAHLNFWYFLKRKMYLKSQPWLRAESLRPISLSRARGPRSGPIARHLSPAPRARQPTRASAPCLTDVWAPRLRLRRVVVSNASPATAVEVRGRTLPSCASNRPASSARVRTTPTTTPPPPHDTLVPAAGYAHDAATAATTSTSSRRSSAALGL